MKVLHVITGLSRSSGGPARSSQGLVAALCKAGVDAWVWPINGGEPWIEGVRKFECSNVLNVQNVRMFDLVHIHGIWSRKLHQVAVMCRKAGVPYVIAPRGMLEPWSLKQKGLKKRIARFLYQDRDLKLAAALHATAESEAEQFRKLGFRNKIIVSPNGVNVPEGDFGTQVAPRIAPRFASGLTAGGYSRHANLAKSDVPTTPTSSKRIKKAPRLVALAEAVQAVVHHQTTPGSCPQDTGILPNRSPSRNGGRRALFVSRMHPKKGVLELVESWARVKNEVKVRGEGERWTCELVYTMNSEEERAYEQKVKQRVHELGLDDQFVFTGALDDEKKWEAYARADLFVLPTYSENFGIVVAEALWAGVPVITTKGTPWAELECSASSKFQVSSSRLEERCGWWIDLPPTDSLDAALREACGADAASPLKEMGRRGHALVESKYTWSAVVKPLVAGYAKII